MNKVVFDVTPESLKMYRLGLHEGMLDMKSDFISLSAGSLEVDSHSISFAEANWWRE